MSHALPSIRGAKRTLQVAASLLALLLALLFAVTAGPLFLTVLSYRTMVL